MYWRSPENTALTQVYVAEFMRLYNHYRGRAIWDKLHMAWAPRRPEKSQNPPPPTRLCLQKHATVG
jgi:hypothetical protein